MKILNTKLSTKTFEYSNCIDNQKLSIAESPDAQKKIKISTYGKLKWKCLLSTVTNNVGSKTIHYWNIQTVDY